MRAFIFLFFLNFRCHRTLGGTDFFQLPTRAKICSSVAKPLRRYDRRKEKSKNLWESRGSAAVFWKTDEYQKQRNAKYDCHLCIDPVLLQVVVLQEAEDSSTNNTGCGRAEQGSLCEVLKHLALHGSEAERQNHRQHRSACIDHPAHDGCNFQDLRHAILLSNAVSIGCSLSIPKN